MKWTKPIWTLVLAGAVLVTVWGWLPSDERRIQKLLASLAEEASTPAQGRALSDLASANRIAEYFAPEFEINVSVPGAPEVSISQRSELVQAIVAARGQQQGGKIELLDPQTVELVPPAAVVDATVRAQARGERDPFIAELRFTLVKTETGWRVQKVVNARTFE
jgi:hypothetical protein